ncbi:MAG: hypothetical protein ACREIT_04725 [Tepidisphaeraceae bacterium]
MAEGSVITPAYVAQLKDALLKRLPGAEVDVEHVRGDRYRFVVVSDQFDGMGHPERQRIVWDLTEATLKPQDLLKVGMILTLGISDLPPQDD